MTFWDFISNPLPWLLDHQIGVTIAVLVFVVPVYMREYRRRQGNCPPQVWFMFSLNIIGVLAGLYVLALTLVATLGKKPANDQQTLMAAFGSIVVVLFTAQNILGDLESLFSKEVQPSQRKQPKKIDTDMASES